MITKSLIYTIFMAMLIAIGIASISTNSIMDAEANSSLKSYIKNSLSPVCGLELCSEYPGGRDAFKKYGLVSFLGTVKLDEKNVIEKKDSDYVNDDNKLNTMFAAQASTSLQKWKLEQISPDTAIQQIDDLHHEYENKGIFTDLIAQVDAQIHMFEFDKITAVQALDEIHHIIESSKIDPHTNKDTSDSNDNKLNTMFAAQASTSLQKWKLEQISPDTAIQQIDDLHHEYENKGIFTDLIAQVDAQIHMFEFDKITAVQALDEIHHIIESSKIEKDH
jgi:DNA-binding LytR/AlgR family response regulator